LASKYSLEVQTIPLSEHDDLYSMDDIEIWEVRRASNVEMKGAEWQNRIIKSGALKMLSWGDIPQVEAQFFNEMIVPISQAIEGTIGCVLWPSSVILSR
jgi:hypothetical protein